MATDVERLVVSLEASITKYERAMSRAVGQTNSTAKRIESRFTSMNQRLGQGFSSLQRNIAAAFAGVAATRGAIQLIDSATRIENSLKVAGLAGEELEQVYTALREAALRNAAPFESLVTLYQRTALVQNELGISTEQLLSFTDTVALALRASGQSAQEASGALLQLSQALGSGVVRAEEFNSILEGAPTILQAAAAGIIEADGSVAKLRQIMLDGNLSSKAFFAGIEAGSAILEEKVANSTLTAGQAFQNLQTRLVDIAREFDNGTNASKLLADGITDLGNGLADLAAFLNNIAGPLQSFVAGMNEAIGVTTDLANEIARITGLERIGFDAAVATNNVTGGVGLVGQSSAAGRVINQTFALVGQTPKDEALARALAGETPPEPLKIVVDGSNPISINDPQYKASPSSSSGGGGSKRDQYAAAVAAQQARIDALTRETSLQSQLNPLVNDYGYAIEKLRAQMELENAAKEQGLALDEPRRQQIDELSSGYARATAEAARLAEAQDMVRQSAEDMANAGRQALDTIIDGFLEGKDAGEIFGNVLKDLGRNLLNMGLNGLFSGGGIGGLFSGLFGGRGFATGTANTGGARGQPRGIVHGQEAVIPLPSGGNVPVDIRMPSIPAAASGGGEIKVSAEMQVIDGNLVPVVTRISGQVAGQQVKAYDRQLPNRLQDINMRQG